MRAESPLASRGAVREAVACSLSGHPVLKVPSSPSEVSVPSNLGFYCRKSLASLGFRENPPSTHPCAGKACQEFGGGAARPPGGWQTFCVTNAQ